MDPDSEEEWSAATAVPPNRPAASINVDVGATTASSCSAGVIARHRASKPMHVPGDLHTPPVARQGAVDGLAAVSINYDNVASARAPAHDAVADAYSRGPATLPKALAGRLPSVVSPPPADCFAGLPNSVCHYDVSSSMSRGVAATLAVAAQPRNTGGPILGRQPRPALSLSRGPPLHMLRRASLGSYDTSSPPASLRASGGLIGCERQGLRRASASSVSGTAVGRTVLRSAAAALPVAMPGNAEYAVLPVPRRIDAWSRPSIAGGL